MNTGVISSRYAKALLEYADELGRAAQVYAQIEALLADPEVMPSELEPALSKTVELLVENGREDFLPYVLRSFVVQYRRSHGIHVASVVTAVDSPELVRKVENLLTSRFGGEVICRSVVNPDIVGGFSLEIDGYLLDASVKRQLDIIRTQLIEKNVVRVSSNL